MSDTLLSLEPDDDDFDFDEEEWDDCGLMPNGQCTKAGSEECDWDCGRLHRARATLQGREDKR